MKAKLIMTATDVNNPGFLQLKRSLDHFGWDYVVLTGNYQAYGSKMVNAYEFAKQTDCTHLFIVDAYDVFVLGTMDQALDRIPDKDIILFNAEKGCWPFSEWASLYPEVQSPWKYVNGGAAFVSVPLFIEMFESNPIRDNDNDQINLAQFFLSQKFNFKLDNNCDLFQSIAFEHPDDFEYLHGKLINKCTYTHPLIIHGNGRTEMHKIYELL